MAGVKITLDLDDAVRALDGMVLPMLQRASNLQPILHRQARLLDGLIGKSFRTSTSPNGEKWPALAESTVAGRRQGSKKPLVDTGQLRSSVTVISDDRSITFGLSGAPQQYGPVHQFGTRRAGRKRSTTIPRRAFLPIDASGETAFRSGAAKKWLADTTERVVEYVLHGKK